MRVAFLATGFPDYSVEAASALARRADVMLLGDRNQLARDSESCKRQAFAQSGRLRGFRQDKLPYRIMSCATVVSELVRFRPHAVIVHEHAHPHIAWIHRQIARLSRSLLIVHDPVPHAGRDGTLAVRNARCILEERAAASGFLVHGAYCARMLAQQGQIGERTILSIPHGPVLRPSLPAIQTYPQRALMFGRMEAYKGLELLLAAFRVIKERGIECELRLAEALALVSSKGIFTQTSSVRRESYK